MKVTNIATLLALLGTKTYALIIPRTDSAALVSHPPTDSPAEFPYDRYQLPFFEKKISQSNYIPSIFDNPGSRWWFGLQSKSAYENQLKSSEKVVTDFVDRVVGYQPMAGMFHANEFNRLLFRIPDSPGVSLDLDAHRVFNHTMQTLRDELPAAIDATNQAPTPFNTGLFQIQLVNDSIPFDPTSELKVRFALSPSSNTSPKPYNLLDTEATGEPRVARFLINHRSEFLPFTGWHVMNAVSQLLFYKEPNGTNVDNLFSFDSSFGGQILQHLLYHPNDRMIGSSVIHTLPHLDVNDSSIPFFVTDQKDDLSNPLIAHVNATAGLRKALQTISASEQELRGWLGVELAKLAMILDPANTQMYRNAIETPLKQAVKDRLSFALRENDRANLQLSLYEANSQFWGRVVAEAIPAMGMLLAAILPHTPLVSILPKKLRQNKDLLSTNLIFHAEQASLAASAVLLRRTQSLGASISIGILYRLAVWLLPLIDKASRWLEERRFLTQEKTHFLAHALLTQRSLPTFFKELVGIQNAVGMLYYLAHRPSIAGRHFAAAYVAKLLTQYVADVLVLMTDRIANRMHCNDHQIQQTFREYDMGYGGVPVFFDQDWDRRLAPQIKRVSNIAHLRWWANNVLKPIPEQDLWRREASEIAKSANPVEMRSNYRELEKLSGTNVLAPAVRRFLPEGVDVAPFKQVEREARNEAIARFQENERGPTEETAAKLDDARANYAAVRSVAKVCDDLPEQNYYRQSDQKEFDGWFGRMLTRLVKEPGGMTTLGSSVFGILGYCEGRGAPMFAGLESSQKAYEASHGYMSSGELVKWKSESHVVDILSNMARLLILAAGNPEQSTHVQDFLNREVGKAFGLKKPYSKHGSQKLVTERDVRQVIDVIQILRKKGSSSAPTVKQQAATWFQSLWRSDEAAIFTQDGWSIISNNHPLLSEHGKKALENVDPKNVAPFIKMLEAEAEKFVTSPQDSDFLSAEGNALLKEILSEQQQTPKDATQLAEKMTLEIFTANAKPALTDLEKLIVSRPDEEPDLTDSMLSPDSLDTVRKARLELASLPEDIAYLLAETTLRTVKQCQAQRDRLQRELSTLDATLENNRKRIKELEAQLAAIPEHPVKNFSWPTKTQHLLDDGVLQQFFMYEKFPHLFEQERLEITRLETKRKRLKDEEAGTGKFNEKTKLPLPPPAPVHPKMPELTAAERAADESMNRETDVMQAALAQYGEDFAQWDRETATQYHDWENRERAWRQQKQQRVIEHMANYRNDVAKHQKACEKWEEESGAQYKDWENRQEEWLQRTEANNQAIAKKVASLVSFYETIDDSVLAELKKQNPPDEEGNQTKATEYQWLPFDKLVAKQFDITTLDQKLEEDLQARIYEILRSEGIKSILLEGMKPSLPPTVSEPSEGIELQVIQPDPKMVRTIWRAAYKNNLLLSDHSPTPEELVSVTQELVDEFLESPKGLDTGAILKRYPGRYVAPARFRNKPFAGNRFVVKVDDDGNAVIMSATKSGIEFLVTAATQQGITLKAGDKTPANFHAGAAIGSAIAKQPTADIPKSASETTDDEEIPLIEDYSARGQTIDQVASTSKEPMDSAPPELASGFHHAIPYEDTAVNTWATATLAPVSPSLDSRPGFDRQGKTFAYGHQFIVQLEGDAASQQAAQRLFDKHPAESTWLQWNPNRLDYRIVAGRHDQPIDTHTRIQLVGHGRSTSGDPAMPADTIAMQSPADLARQFKTLMRNERHFAAPKKISLSACASKLFAKHLSAELFRQGTKTAVSGREIDFAINEASHKVTLGPNPVPVGERKTTYQPDEAGQPIATPGSSKRYAGKVTAVDLTAGTVTVSIPAASLRASNTETVAVGKEAAHRFTLGGNVKLLRTDRGPVIEIPEPQVKLSRVKTRP